MARNRISPGICATLLVLVACNAPPGSESGSRIPPSNQTIKLLPLDALLAQAKGGTANDASAAALAARAARLRAQAGAH